MIQIQKSNNVPAILANEGVTETALLCAQFDANPNHYKNGHLPKPIRFVFRRDIYADETVKTQLMAEQHFKCCFCETKDIDVTSYGDVEHFRPKAAYKQNKKDRLSRPGYYWLAYSWDNLFYSCQICNQKYKRNWFPLNNPAKRQTDHNKPVEVNTYLSLIHPVDDVPENEIGFRLEIPFNKTQKGKKSINVYGLKRKRLNEKRAKFLEEFKKQLMLSKINPHNLTNSEKQEIMSELGTTDFNDVVQIVQLAIMVRNNGAFDNAEYSLMIRNNFPHLPRR